MPAHDRFKTHKGEQVNVRVASFISPEQAELNLKSWAKITYTRLRAKGRKVWNVFLGRIEVKMMISIICVPSPCLYRSGTFPQKFLRNRC